MFKFLVTQILRFTLPRLGRIKLDSFALQITFGTGVYAGVYISQNYEVYKSTFRPNEDDMYHI